MRKLAAKVQPDFSSALAEGHTVHGALVLDGPFIETKEMMLSGVSVTRAATAQRQHQTGRRRRECS